MKIKDVENLTGLTAKSIRYYESKGLLQVERNEENSYREYSEEHVSRLRWIRLFRYLNFSIEEIADIIEKNETEIKEVLREKAERLSEQKENCALKQEMCLTLAKEYENSPQAISEYNEAIDYIESEEMEELNEKLKDYGCPNLSSTIAATLICLGPVLWLFYNINSERWDGLLVNAICAIVGTALLTVNWIHYITKYRRHKNRVKKNNRKWMWMWPTMIIAIVVGIFAVVGIFILNEKILVPDNYLFYEHNPIAGKMMIILIMIPAFLICLLIMAKLSKKKPQEVEDMNDIVFIWNHLGKIRPVIIILWIVGLYCCMTSRTIVTEDEIICCSPINPKGTSYEYSEVESIKTGFGNKSFAFVEYKQIGEFYYQLELAGKTITLHHPNVNPDIKRYEEDTYLELEEFDQALVRIGIPKNASAEGYENCDLDKQYVDRFLRIIN